MKNDYDELTAYLKLKKIQIESKIGENNRKVLLQNAKANMLGIIKNWLEPAKNNGLISISENPIGHITVKSLICDDGVVYFKPDNYIAEISMYYSQKDYRIKYNMETNIWYYYDVKANGVPKIDEFTHESFISLIKEFL